MASSTNSPMAIAKPPNVKVLIEISKDLRIIAVIISEIGIAVSVITVVLTFKRNRNRMMMTSIKPSRKANSTFLKEFSIKCFC